MVKILTRIREQVKTTIDKTSGAVNSAVAAAPTTNWKTALALFSAFGSVIMFWIVLFFRIELDPIALGTLFAFILTWLYDGRKQFEIKRFTEWVPNGYTNPNQNQYNYQKGTQEEETQARSKLQATSRREYGALDGTEPI